MKQILSLLVVFLAVTLVKAQTKDEIAVAAAVERLNKGILDPDKALLESIASEGLSYGHSAGKVQNKAEFVEDLLHGTFDFLTVATSNQKIMVSGKNAIVRHTFVAKATNAGTPVDLNIGNLLVWRKEGGKWKLIARQAFKIPGT
jgi:thioredoxin-related protein